MDTFHHVKGLQTEITTSSPSFSLLPYHHKQAKRSNMTGGFVDKLKHPFKATKDNAENTE